MSLTSFPITAGGALEFLLCVPSSSAASKGGEGVVCNGQCLACRGSNPVIWTQILSVKENAVLLQGIFPTQGLSLHPLHCRGILYQWEELFRKAQKRGYCRLFHPFTEAPFLKFLVHWYPALRCAHSQNQSTPCQLSSPSQLYCSTWILPFQTLLLLIYPFSPLSLISLSNAWFPSANILQHLSS